MAKSVILFVLLAILLIAAAPTTFGAARIYLDEVIGVYNGKAIVDHPIRFKLRAEYTPGDETNIIAFSNGFRVWTEANGAYTNNFTPVTFDTIPITPPWLTRFELAVEMAANGVDGIGEDTVGLFAVYMVGQGFEDGFNQQIFWIETTPTVVGDTLCLDSAVFNPPSGAWMWVKTGNIDFAPGWEGPYCFEVSEPEPVYVCGDVNSDAVVNVLDLTVMINYLYKGGPPPQCPWE